MVQRNPFISRSELACIVRDHRTMYELMIRNGFVMPSRKQRICTLQFMYDARSGVIWCPK